MVSSLDLWHRYRMSNFLKYLHPLLILAATGIAWAGDWYPVEVDVREPPFNTEHQLVQKSYTPLNEADKRWNICVSIPHLKDAYWLAVNYGFVDEARRMGVNLAIYPVQQKPNLI